MDRLDPRSPLVVDTRDLDRRPGSMLELVRTVPAPEEFGSDVIAVAAGDPIAVRLRLEAVTEGVLVSGSAAATATGTCVRCLEPLQEDVSADFQELYAYPDRAAHHKHTAQRSGDEAEDVEEQLELVGDLLDIEPVLRDSLVPALPFQPVCSPDCPGLCSECGARLADEPGHRHDVLDPRWADLRGLRQG